MTAEGEAKKLVLIDGKSVFYRGYYAMPNLSLKDGTPTGGVFGFATLATEIIRRLNPDYVAVAWDKPKTNIRKRLQIYPDYKAGRKPAPADFYVQIPILHELLEALGWPLYELDDYEADDIMAGLAKKAEASGIETILVTSDLDALQCISDKTKVYALKKGLSNIEQFHPESFTAKYGLRPDQFLDLKSLQGDSSDNIPGVPGVGAKTASELLKKYNDLDNIYDNIELISGKVKDKLVAGKQSAYMSKQLATLYIDAPIELDLNAMDVSKFNAPKLKGMLERLEFKSLLRQMPELEEVESTHQAKQIKLNKYDLVNLKAFIWPENNLIMHVFAKDKQATSAYGIILANANQVTIIDNPNKEISLIRSKHKNTKIIGYDTKTAIKYFLGQNIKLTVEHDIKVASFILNSLNRNLELDNLANDELGLSISNINDIPPEDIGVYAQEFASAIDGLYNLQVKELKNQGKLADIAKHMDFAIIPLLAKMELAGIKIDTNQLRVMSRELEDSISDIEQNIYGYAEQEFNISSPSQLAEVLFESMGLPRVGIKKGKTGLSTAASELNKLRTYHPIIDLISQYRELTKLKSTYVDTLPNNVGIDGRVHTNFNLTIAQTGRLSSTEPNLQNIPIRTEVGRKIRKAFVAEDGYSFVSADYSQFELRLASVLSGDFDMIETFNNGTDIHTRTAAEVYGVALDDVSAEMRANAKTINFGVLYGMSPHGLSVATGMTRDEAKAFIDKYFATRQPLIKYIEQIKNLAKEQGYVETLFGRRRPTPDVNSSNFIVREAGFRQAVNMPIQGTEADLMKLAMLKVDKLLPKMAKQLLQIHDSILVECLDKDVEAVATIMKKTMENVYPGLGINLQIDIKTGKTWAEL
jgi:DNA polymerase-1